MIHRVILYRVDSEVTRCEERHHLTVEVPADVARALHAGAKGAVLTLSVETKRDRQIAAARSIVGTAAAEKYVGRIVDAVTGVK